MGGTAIGGREAIAIPASRSTLRARGLGGVRLWQTSMQPTSPLLPILPVLYHSLLPSSPPTHSGLRVPSPGRSEEGTSARVPTGAGPDKVLETAAPDPRAASAQQSAGNMQSESVGGRPEPSGRQIGWARTEETLGLAARLPNHGAPPRPGPAGRRGRAWCGSVASGRGALRMIRSLSVLSRIRNFARERKLSRSPSVDAVPRNATDLRMHDTSEREHSKEVSKRIHEANP
jgi:hypothetical protein